MNRSQIVWLIIGIFVTMGLYFREKERRYLLENKAFSVGEIVRIDYRGSYKSSNIIYYRHTINGKLIERSFSFPNYLSRSADTIVGIKFPVLYNKQDGVDGMALLYKKQFDDYDLPQPDSLKWVNKYFGY